MRFFKVLCIIFLVALQSCGLDKPTENEIIGDWYNKDGSEIFLKKNGKFYGKNLSVYAFYLNDTIDKFNGSGKWVMLEKNGKWIVDLDFKEKSIYKDKIVSINSKLFINGDGFFGTKRPLHMYLQVGDPDQDNRYEFKKK
jgi:hypothetical protein